MSHLEGFARRPLRPVLLLLAMVLLLPLSSPMSLLVEEGAFFAFGALFFEAFLLAVVEVEDVLARPLGLGDSSWASVPSRRVDEDPMALAGRGKA